MIDERWRKIERAVAEYLRQYYMILVPADLPAGNGHGPRLEGNRPALTLADLLEPRHGWIEVKYKLRSWLYDNFNEELHGIDAPKWLEYCKLRDYSRLPFYLMILEESTGHILMQSLDTLRGIPEQVFTRGHFRPGQPSINWKRSDFVHVGQFILDGDEPIISPYWPPLDGILSQLSLDLEVA
jgi:hypothetical protein